MTLPSSRQINLSQIKKVRDFLGTSTSNLVYSQTTGQQYAFCSPYVYSGYISSGSFNFYLNNYNLQ